MTHGVHRVKRAVNRFDSSIFTVRLIKCHDLNSKAKGTQICIIYEEDFVFPVCQKSIQFDIFQYVTLLSTKPVTDLCFVVVIKCELYSKSLQPTL